MQEQRDPEGTLLKNVSGRKHRATDGMPPFRSGAAIRAATMLLGAAAALLVLCGSAPASDGHVFGKAHEVIGSTGRYTVEGGESLYEIARTYRTGFNHMAAANPGVDPFVPGRGTSLLLPTSWILPDASRAPGIVINLSDMRLYHFFVRYGVPLVRMYPIGIGEEGAHTPLGTFTVVEKIKDPAWHVPASIRRERPELPEVIPPGPDNPMGSRALRLSRRTVLIHGTDMPWGIGSRVSHGCIRLYPEDILTLFRFVAPKTKVTIVQQPMKAGISNGRVYVEANDDSGLKGYDAFTAAMDLLGRKGLLDRVDLDALARAAREKRGIPVDINRMK